MKLATTTGDFFEYVRDYKECVRLACEAGFRYLDLSMYVIMDNDPLLIADDFRTYAKELKDYATSLGATFVQAHSPGGNPLLTDGSEKRLLDATIRSIEVCGELGIPNIVVHAGELPGISKEESFKLNKQFYEKLFPAMEQNHVNVLCENSTRANMGDIYYTNTGADMKEFVAYVDHPLFHACWDTGHANCEGSQYDEMMCLGKDLYAVHINDNRGFQDEHVIPYLGTVNMDEILHALLDLKFSGPFTFEAGSSLRPSKYWLGFRHDFDRETRLAEPKLFMQESLEKLMFDIGVYMLKAYDCYEE